MLKCLKIQDLAKRGHSRYRFFTAFIVCASLSSFLYHPHAFANPAFFRLLETPMSRFIFTHTPEGKALLTQVVRTHENLSRPTRSISYSRFIDALRDSSETMPEVGEELEQALAEARSILQEYHSGPSLKRRLSDEEKLLLKQFAARNLRLNAEWKPQINSDQNSQQIEFFKQPESLSSLTFQKKFLTAPPVDPAYESILSNGLSNGAAKIKGLRQVNRFFAEMNSCIKKMPPQEAKKQQLRYLLTGVGLSELFTVGGYVAGSGSKVVDWHNLPTDLLMVGLSSLIGNRLVMGNNPFLIRWIRVVAYGIARSSVDAVVYYVTPLKDTHGVSVDEATQKRLEYNIMWNSATAVNSVALYTMLTGLECLYPGAKMAATSTGIRFVNSAVNSVIYFKLRNQYTGADHSPEQMKLQQIVP